MQRTLLTRSARVGLVRSTASLRSPVALASRVSSASTLRSAACLSLQPHLAASAALARPLSTRAVLNAATIPSTNASPSLSNLPPVAFFQRLASPGALDATAISVGSELRSYTELLSQARSVHRLLTRTLGSSDLRDTSVALLYPSGFDYTAVLLGVWLAGGIAVPLHSAHTKPELEYLLSDSKARIMLHAGELSQLAESLTLPRTCEQRLRWESAAQESDAAASAEQPQNPSYGSRDDFLRRRAMMIYTSGTTGRPKGVVWTHGMFDTQLSLLTQAWRWSARDHILHVLPLHHVHGVINVLLCALYAGARVSFLPGKASTEAIARALGGNTGGSDDLTLFMAVPTIYSRLLSHADEMSETEREQFKESCARFRLMVSGSAALPAPVLEKWQRLTGLLLLERYGMSETGMILSQSADETMRRKQVGTVGAPLPTVQTKVVPVEGEQDAPGAADEITRSGAQQLVGSLRVRGPSVFSEYWNLPEKTRAEFDADGWFTTGDVVAVDLPAESAARVERTSDGGYIIHTESNDQVQPLYKLLGRASVDVLKSGGYKISALEVERVLLSHPEIEEAAVVGVADDEYGQLVAAIVALKPGAACSSAQSLQQWARTQLATYQVPRLWRIVKHIPRNAMGKTNKKELVKLFDKASSK